MSSRCDTSLCMLTIASIWSWGFCTCALAAWLYMCVDFPKQCGVAQSHTVLGFLCTLLCVSSQEDMVFVPEHFNVYLETMAWNKRREAERERDNEVSKLRESTPHTMELTWILWKAPGVNSFTVLVCLQAAAAFTVLMVCLFSFILMWRMLFAL